MAVKLHFIPMDVYNPAEVTSITFSCRLSRFSESQPNSKHQTESSFINICSSSCTLFMSIKKDDKHCLYTMPDGIQS